MGCLQSKEENRSGQSHQPEQPVIINLSEDDDVTTKPTNASADGSIRYTPGPHGIRSSKRQSFRVRKEAALKG